MLKLFGGGFRSQPNSSALSVDLELKILKIKLWRVGSSSIPWVSGDGRRLTAAVVSGPGACMELLRFLTNPRRVFWSKD